MIQPANPLLAPAPPPSLTRAEPRALNSELRSEYRSERQPADRSFQSEFDRIRDREQQAHRSDRAEADRTSSPSDQDRTYETRDRTSASDSGDSSPASENHGPTSTDGAANDASSTPERSEGDRGDRAPSSSDSSDANGESRATVDGAATADGATTTTAAQVVPVVAQTLLETNANGAHRDVPATSATAASPTTSESNTPANSAVVDPRLAATRPVVESANGDPSAPQVAKGGHAEIDASKNQERATQRSNAERPSEQASAASKSGPQQADATATKQERATADARRTDAQRTEATNDERRDASQRAQSDRAQHNAGVVPVASDRRPNDGQTRNANAPRITVGAAEHTAANSAESVEQRGSVIPEALRAAVETASAAAPASIELDADADRGADRPRVAPAIARAINVDAAVKIDQAAQQLAPLTTATPGELASRTIAATAGSLDPRAVEQLLTDDSSRVDESKFTGRVVRGLSTMVNQRGGLMSMRLTPSELGNLRVQMSIVQGTVTAQFTASTEQAQQLLNRNIAALRQSLESHGLNVERLAVTVAPSGDANAGRAGDGDGQAHHHSAQRDAEHDAAGHESLGRHEHEHTHHHRSRGEQDDFASAFDGLEPFDGRDPFERPGTLASPHARRARVLSS